MITMPKLPAIGGYVEVEYGNERIYKRISDNMLFHSDMTPLEDQTIILCEEEPVTWAALDAAYQEGVSTAYDQ